MSRGCSHLHRPDTQAVLGPPTDLEMAASKPQSQTQPIILVTTAQSKSPGKGAHHATPEAPLDIHAQSHSPAAGSSPGPSVFTAVSVDENAVLAPGFLRLNPSETTLRTKNAQTISPQVNPRERTIDEIAQISVARQVSISKRQRHLLVPIISKPARQPMVPKLVDGEQGTESLRRSHYLTLENA